MKKSHGNLQIPNEIPKFPIISFSIPPKYCTILIWRIFNLTRLYQIVKLKKWMKKIHRDHGQVKLGKVFSKYLAMNLGWNREVNQSHVATLR